MLAYGDINLHCSPPCLDSFRTIPGLPSCFVLSVRSGYQIRNTWIIPDELTTVSARKTPAACPERGFVAMVHFSSVSGQYSQQFSDRRHGFKDVDAARRETSDLVPLLARFLQSYSSPGW